MVEGLNVNFNHLRRVNYKNFPNYGGELIALFPLFKFYSCISDCYAENVGLDQEQDVYHEVVIKAQEQSENRKRNLRRAGAGFGMLLKCIGSGDAIPCKLGGWGRIFFRRLGFEKFTPPLTPCRSKKRTTP